MKTLNAIQVLAKIGKVLSTIIYVCCIVGAVGCVVGMICIPFADTGMLKIGGVTVYGLLANSAGIELNSLYPMMAGAMIMCIGEGITAKFAERYFGHELKAGTPFTESGAKELMRLGILTICVPLGALILAQIVGAVMAQFMGGGDLLDLRGGDSIGIGVTFIIASLLCKYGAELNEKGDRD